MGDTVRGAGHSINRRSCHDDTSSYGTYASSRLAAVPPRHVDLGAVATWPLPRDRYVGADVANVGPGQPLAAGVGARSGWLLGLLPARTVSVSPVSAKEKCLTAVWSRGPSIARCRRGRQAAVQESFAVRTTAPRAPQREGDAPAAEDVRAIAEQFQGRIQTRAARAAI